MYYWQWPNTYDWTSMNQTSGSPETARLMYDIGTTQMPPNYTHLIFSWHNLVNYGETETSAYYSDVKNNLPLVFSNFNYSLPGTYSNSIDLTTLQPALVGGYTGDGLTGPTGEGHEWVCSGQRITTGYITMVGSILINEYYFLWGHGGSNDGWYTAYTPPGKNYQYYTTAVNYIHP
jgi:hypothetical protein